VPSITKHSDFLKIYVTRHRRSACLAILAVYKFRDDSPKAFSDDLDSPGRHLNRYTSLNYNSRPYPSSDDTRVQSNSQTGKPKPCDGLESGRVPSLKRGGLRASYNGSKVLRKSCRMNYQLPYRSVIATAAGSQAQAAKTLIIPLEMPLVLW